MGLADPLGAPPFPDVFVAFAPVDPAALLMSRPRGSDWLGGWIGPRRLVGAFAGATTEIVELGRRVGAVGVVSLLTAVDHPPSVPVIR